MLLKQVDFSVLKQIKVSSKIFNISLNDLVDNDIKDIYYILGIYNLNLYDV